MQGATQTYMRTQSLSQLNYNQHELQKILLIIKKGDFPKWQMWFTSGLILVIMNVSCIYLCMQCYKEKSLFSVLKC